MTTAGITCWKKSGSAWGKPSTIRRLLWDQLIKQVDAQVEFMESVIN